MGLVDKMIALLGKEANDDKIKKEMCEVGLTRNDDTKATIENGVKSKSAEVANMKDNLAIIVKDMAKIKSDMTERDKTVKEATAQRQQENAAFTQMLSETNQAVGILEVAKTRLKEFYPAEFIQQPSAQAPSFLQEGEGEAESSREDDYSFMEGAGAGSSLQMRKPQSQGGKVVLTMIDRTTLPP